MKPLLFDQLKLSELKRLIWLPAEFARASLFDTSFRQPWWLGHSEGEAAAIDAVQAAHVDYDILGLVE
jgi:hypothetical protein